MRRGANTRRMREYAILPAKNILRNYLKYLRHVQVDICTQYELTPSQFQFLLFIYDLEFFTLMYARTHFAPISDNKMRIIYTKPLMNKGLIDVYISRQSVTEEDKQLFMLDNGVGYGARLALSQKGRLLVQKIYRKLEGKEAINASE